MALGRNRSVEGIQNSTRNSPPSFSVEKDEITIEGASFNTETMSTVSLVERVRDDTISERKGWKGAEG
jgi:hypothetical protein